MITRLYVDNYACLTNFELKFTPTTLLVGDNGAGKSMVLEVLQKLQRLFDGGEPAELFPASSRTRWSSQSRQTIELEVNLDGSALNYRLELEHSASKVTIALEDLGGEDGSLAHLIGGVVTTKAGSFDFGWQKSALPLIAGGAHGPIQRFADFFRRILFCSPLPPSMKGEASTESMSLDLAGRNFVAWYRHQSQERQDALVDLNSGLREVIDGFKGLRLVASGKDSRTLTALFTEPSKFELDFDELSDGQRMLIVLYSLLHLTADQGYSLWLDEPVNFVALREIQPWIIALRDACGGEIAQAVVCSHHPELIDYLGPDDGQMLQRKNGGPTTVRPLHEVASTEGLRLSETLARGWQA